MRDFGKIWKFSVLEERGLIKMNRVFIVRRIGCVKDRGFYSWYWIVEVFAL